MSSKIEVSRELLEQLASPYTGLRNQAMYALRALLAAPVVERQPVYQVEGLLDGGGGWFDADKGKYERCAKNPKMYRTRVIYLEPSVGLDA